MKLLPQSLPVRLAATITYSHHEPELGVYNLSNRAKKLYELTVIVDGYISRRNNGLCLRPLCVCYSNIQYNMIPFILSCYAGLFFFWKKPSFLFPQVFFRFLPEETGKKTEETYFLLKLLPIW